MNQPTRGLPACLDLLEQCLFGQMSIYFSWRDEGARADQGRHCVQHAAPRSLHQQFSEWSGGLQCVQNTALLLLSSWCWSLHGVTQERTKDTKRLKTS